MLHHIITTTLHMMDAMNADEYNGVHESLLIYLMLLSSCCDCYPFRVLIPFDKANNRIMMDYSPDTHETLQKIISNVINDYIKIKIMMTIIK